MYRERLTITLDAGLLQAIDSLVDGEQLRNRSQTIEHLLKEGMGLHELTQAFVFPDENADLERLALLFKAAGIATVYLCLPLSLKSMEAELSKPFADFTLELVPADFGTGGSVSLKRSELTTPFLLAWMGATPLPASLLPPFLFHRAHHGLLTELVSRTPEGFASSGLYVASSELAANLPAGASDLARDTFPALLKEDRVKGYFYST